MEISKLKSIISRAEDPLQFFDNLERFILLKISHECLCEPGSDNLLQMTAEANHLDESNDEVFLAFDLSYMHQTDHHVCSAVMNPSSDFKNLNRKQILGSL